MASMETKLSPSQITKRWSVGKTKVYELMNSGELAFEVNDKGNRICDLSEVVRVLGEPRSSKEVKKTSEEHSAVELMREMIEKQEKANAELIKALQERIDSQEKQIEALNESLTNTTLLLSHGRDKPAEEQKDDVIHVAPEKAEQVTPKQVKTVSEPEPVQQAAKRKGFLGRLGQAAAQAAKTIANG